MKTMDKKSMKEKSNTYIMNECKKILNSETSEQTNKWFKENEISSYILRNEKASYTIELANQILIYLQEKEDSFLHRLVNLLNSNIKCYEYCRYLKHFAKRDSEFAYIYDFALDKHQHPGEFYLRCRSCIIKSFLNKGKKELITPIVGDESEWFKVITEIFRKQRQDELVDLYVGMVKKHYKFIKKNQNEKYCLLQLSLNGGQIFLIAQLMKEQLPEKHDEFTYIEISKVSLLQKSRPKTENKGMNKKILEDLEVDDRQFIRALSYKDENIAKLLQQKHNRMIEMITEDVEDMRRNIQQERRKYVQIIKQKDQIIRQAKLISECGLLYMQKNSLERQSKLLEAIQKFNNNHLSKQLKIEKTKQLVNERRIIEQIQRQQRQLD